MWCLNAAGLRHMRHARRPKEVCAARATRGGRRRSAPHAPRAAAEGPDDFKANWVRGQAIRDAGGMTGIK